MTPCPADQRDVPILKFETRDRAGHQTTASVKVGRPATHGTSRAVRVTADYSLPAGPHPVDDPPVDTTLFPDVVWKAHIASHAETLEVLKGTHSAPADHTEPVALEIGLVSMDDKHLLPGLGVFQDQPLVGDQSILVYAMSSAILNVMVADDEV
jgi:hypothetical protein